VVPGIGEVMLATFIVQPTKFALAITESQYWYFLLPSLLPPSLFLFPRLASLPRLSGIFSHFEQGGSAKNMTGFGVFGILKKRNYIYIIDFYFFYKNIYIYIFLKKKKTG